MSKSCKSCEWGNSLSFILVGLMALGAAMPAIADRDGMFGYPNLIANPDFENATIDGNSHSGAWGYFQDNKVVLFGWTGYGKAGVAAVTDTTVWVPWDSGKDDYRVFIQMADGLSDDSSWIEQTVVPSKSGTYVFSCKYATRHHTANNGSGELGVSVVCGDTTNNYTAAFANGDFRYRYSTWYLALEAGQSYTIRLHGVQDVADSSKDRTVVIGACSLERLPQPDRTISGECHLRSNEDWSNATIDLAPGTAVHLDGHTLKIGRVRSNASGTSPVFTDSTATPGELRVTVSAGDELANCGWSVSGGVTLVKDGPGVFEWRGGTIADTAPVFITNGVFRLGTYQANLFGASGVVTVRDKGQFDMNWSYAGKLESPVFCREFRVEGDGPDGSGAIVNKGVYHASCGEGYHFKKVVMTGDATFGGATRIDFRGNNVGLYGTNRTLTVKGTKVAFCQGTAAYLDCGDVVLADGGELEPCNDGGIMNITGTCYINHGGILSSWANGDQILTFPVVVGEGGGTIRTTKKWYRINAPITVEAGSVLNCPTDGPWYGGAITNGAGAAMNIGGDFFAVGGIVKNDGVIVHTAGKLYFGSRDDQKHPCRVENNGTIRTTGGNFYFRSENHAHGAGVFEFNGGNQTVAGDLSDFTGTIRLAGGTNTFSSVASFGGTLVLAGGVVATSLSGATGLVVLDLSALSAPLDVDSCGYLTLPSGKDVTVNLDGRQLVPGEKLLAWSDVPDLAFSHGATMAQCGVPLVSAADGLYFGDGRAEPVRATWTGTADNGAFADVHNWTCYDGDGNPLANAIPVPGTAITLGADVPQGGWTSFPVSAQTGAIDLNGHRLGIIGQGALALSVTNSSAGSPGELRIIVPEGVTFSKTEAFTIDGNLTLVKDGAGTLSWTGGTLADSVSLVVTDGVFRVGIGTSGTFGTGGTITVAGTGQFDFNSQYYNNDTGKRHSPAKVRTFYIEGDGPDGSGALYNSLTTGGGGYQLQTVILTGDATIGGTSRLDFRGGSSDEFGLDGGGHTLTIKNTGMVAFCSGTYLRNCADIVLADGGVMQPCSGCTLQITGKVRLESGGVFANWSDNKKTQNFVPPFVVGEGGGIIRSDNYWYSINGSITVESGGALDFPTMAPWYEGAITNKTGATMNIYPSSGPQAPFQFVAKGGIFVNDGTVNHMAGEFWLGDRDGSGDPCRVENNGTISTSGGNFHFNADSTAHGAGVFEFAGGSSTAAGDFSDFTGTIRISGGTTTFSSSATFPGTLVLRDGALASGTSLAAFAGTARIDLAGQELPLNVDGKNWFTFEPGKEVFVDVGGRKLQPDERLISWTTPPTNRVRFTLTNGQNGTLMADANGVIYQRQGMCLCIW